MPDGSSSPKESVPWNKLPTDANAKENNADARTVNLLIVQRTTQPQSCPRREEIGNEGDQAVPKER
jgi:deoxyhypusine synthase